MYKTTNQNKTEALLWLFITSRGLLQDFTEFCRERKEKSLAEVEKELREAPTKQK